MIPWRSTDVIIPAVACGVVVLTAMVLCGCGGDPVEHAANPSANCRSSQSTMQALRDGYEQGISCSYESVLNPRFTQADVDAAREYILDKPDERSYLVLLALRNSDRRAYDSVAEKTRARVLCRALGGRCAMDDWGSLWTIHWSREGFSEDALKETGIVAIPELERLLDCDDQALFISGGAMTTASHHKWRIKDFAAKYIRLVLGWKGSYSDDPTSRDKDIDRLREGLQEWHKKDAGVLRNSR